MKKSLINNKYLIGKLFDFAKYAVTVGLLVFVVAYAPQDAQKLITALAAFMLGRSKLGL